MEAAMNAFENYDAWLTILGIAILLTAVLPRILSNFPFSMPISLFLFGFACSALPLGLESINPFKQGVIIERVTELGVIVALMGSGLKIDRLFSFRSWKITWWLLGVTMILSIAMTSFIGWSIMLFSPATAVLLGAVIAPTDPVLSSDVQTTFEKSEDEVRFALTSEAGLNDGLAFPFTNLAIGITVYNLESIGWLGSWLMIDVGYKIFAAILVGVLLGNLLAKFILAIPSKSELSKSMIGMGALAATLIIYGAAQCIGSYGFIATFTGAVAIRNYEQNHEYQKEMHHFIEKSERLFSALILVAFGGAVAGGLFNVLAWPTILAAILILFFVRPVSGLVGLIPFKQMPWRERLAISFFGIRGIGSLYYLAFALNRQYFSNEEEIWALTGLVIVLSIFIHGIFATPVTRKLDQLRNGK